RSGGGCRYSRAAGRRRRGQSATLKRRRSFERREHMVKNSVSRVAVFIVLGLLVAATSAHAQDTRPGVAVLPFAQGVSIGTDRQDLEALSIGLQQIMITELAQNPDVRVVERGM